jgi:hypothetical protein
MQTKETLYQAEMLHYLMFHSMNQQKDLPWRLVKFQLGRSKPQIDEKWRLQLFPHIASSSSKYSHISSSRTASRTLCYMHFRCLQTIIFLAYITVNLYTSVSAVISISCVCDPKRLFTSYVISCYPWHRLCWQRLYYPIPVIEILRTWCRKIHLQPKYVMMFLVTTLHPVIINQTVCAHSSPFSRSYPMSLFTTHLIKQTDARRYCGSSSRVPAVLGNQSNTWAYALQHPPPLYTHA